MRPGASQYGYRESYILGDKTENTEKCVETGIVGIKYMFSVHHSNTKPFISLHISRKSIVNPGGGSIMLMLLCSRPWRACEGGGQRNAVK